MTDEDDFVRITLRIPKVLHSDLTEAAAKKRSMNAEIIERLEKSFKPILATDIPIGEGNMYELLLSMDARMREMQRRLDLAEKK